MFATNQHLSCVSVIIPSYNTGKTIIQSIDSVLNTHYPNLEIIIVDDGSKDDSVGIINNYIASNKTTIIRFLIHPNGKNLGIASTRNLGIRNGSGKYMAFLDADDLYLPNRFEKCISIMENDHSIDAICEPFYYLYLSGKRGSFVEDQAAVFSRQSLGYEAPEKTRKCDEIFYDLLFRRKVPHTSSITVRTSVFRKTGLFPNLKYCLEPPLWLKIFSLNSTKDGSSEAVSNYVLHDNSTCDKKQDTAAFVFEYTEAMINAYEWMQGQRVALEYINAIKSTAIDKYYHYCANVFTLDYTYFHDILRCWLKMALAFPFLLRQAKFWKVAIRQAFIHSSLIKT